MKRLGQSEFRLEYREASKSKDNPFGGARCLIWVKTDGAGAADLRVEFANYDWERM